MDGLVYLLLLGILGVVYFIPWIIAYKTDHPHLIGIAIVNLFFGFTGWGWLVALVWAYWKPRDSSKT